MTGGGGGPILLIVDDEPVVALSLSRLFERRGYVVRVAGNGAAAIDVLRRESIDVMLVDFQLPDMPGDVLFATAVAIQPSLEVRTVFVTGDISDTVTEALGNANCPIVLKPFETAELEALVRSVLDRAQKPRRPGGGTP